MSARTAYVRPEGTPDLAAVPTGVPTNDGSVLPILALVMGPEVPRAEIDEFLKRHRFVHRDETAKAVDSQARWSQERDGRVVFSFLDDEGAARIAMPADPMIQRWAMLARATGGTISVMVLPDMPSHDLADIGVRIKPGGRGEYWHLSVGLIPAQRGGRR